tara:strand:+ start:225 stop:470 length:246 start_codon:yes stop_codon:yes gene_type:complete
MPEEQQYFVEVFDSKFNPLCHIGPVNHVRALEVHEEYKKRKMLSCITEKEFVDLINKKAEEKKKQYIAKSIKALLNEEHSH